LSELSCQDILKELEQKTVQHDEELSEMKLELETTLMNVNLMNRQINGLYDRFDDGRMNWLPV